MTEHEKEYPDHHIYQGVMFPSSGVEFYLNALKYYLSLLEDDIAALDEDMDLKAILSLQKRETLEIFQERDKVQRLVDWLSLDGGARKQGIGDWPIEVSHGVLRYMKSAGILYLNKLRQSRERIATRVNSSKYTLETVDRQLAVLEENYCRGVFAKVSPMPLLVEEFATAQEMRPEATGKPASAVKIEKPRVRLIETIEILDSQLRERCMDLFIKFQEDGQSERLDTVITEATRVLEDRLRSKSGGPPDKVGGDLATFALSPKDPKLVVSELNGEQEAAHLLFRGVFGFIRNHVHHQLVGNLLPERALQIVGLTDYLLSVVEAAQRKLSEGDTV